MSRSRRETILIEAPISLGLLFIPLANNHYFPDSYVASKWLVVFGMASLCCVNLALFLRNTFIPIPIGWQIWLTGALFAIFTFNHFYHQTQFQSTSSLTIICTLVLIGYGAWYSSQFRPSQLLWASFGVSLCAVLLLALREYFTTSMVTANLDNNLFSATFGNINMLAEYLGLSAICALAACQLASDRCTKFFFAALYFLCLLIVLLTDCRSVLIAVAILFLGNLIIGKKRNAGSYKLIAVGATLFFAFAVADQLNWLPQVHHYFGASKSDEKISEKKREYREVKLASKQNTANWRLEMYQETIDMIHDNPLGVGTGKFAFSYAPYEAAGIFWPSEFRVFRSPHNEYLRIATEEGLPFTLVISLFMASMAWLYLGNSEVSTKEKIFASNIFAFLAIQMCFQFPLELPYPLFCGSLLIGVMLNQSFPSTKSLTFTKPLRFLSIVTCCALMFLTYQYAIGQRYILSPNVQESKQSCAAMADNWQGCAKLTFNLLEQGAYSEAYEIIISELRKRPFNYAALNSLILYYKAVDPSKLCQPLVIYQALFRGKTSFAGLAEENCADSTKVKEDIIRHTYQNYISQLLTSETNRK